MTVLFRICRVAFGMVAWSGVVSANEGQQMRIAVVDFKQLYVNYQGTAKLKEEVVGMLQRVDEMQREDMKPLFDLEREVQEYDRKLEKTDVLNKERTQLQYLRNRVVERAQELDRVLRERYERRRRAVHEEVAVRDKALEVELRKYVEEKAKGLGYEWVLDRGAESPGMVPFLLYTKDGADITALLLEDIRR